MPSAHHINPVICITVVHTQLHVYIYTHTRNSPSLPTSAMLLQLLLLAAQNRESAHRKYRELNRPFFKITNVN